jgi:hypothetical protein
MMVVVRVMAADIVGEVVVVVQTAAVGMRQCNPSYRSYGQRCCSLASCRA